MPDLTRTSPKPVVTDPPVAPKPGTGDPLPEPGRSGSTVRICPILMHQYFQLTIDAIHRYQPARFVSLPILHVFFLTFEIFVLEYLLILSVILRLLSRLSQSPRGGPTRAETSLDTPTFRAAKGFADSWRNMAFTTSTQS